MRQLPLHPVWSRRLCAVLALASLIGQGCSSKGSQPSPRGGLAAPVTVTTVGRNDVPIDIQVIGSVEAYSTISVRAQVGGQLTRVYFQEGNYVRTGDPLFTIDPRPLQSQLQQAEANLARSTAQLSLAQANLAKDMAQEQYAQAQAARYLKLQQEGIISKEQQDQFRTNADALAQGVTADKASIESARAEIAATRAAVENAKLQLSYTTIPSPIDGRTGNLMIKQGNLVSANSMDLTTITQVQPIYVTFSVPEAQLAAIKRYMARAKLAVAAIPQDGESRPETGVLSFVDNTVDPSTGTIKLKATFPNQERRLWPGQFIRVALRLTTQANALVVPNQAVQTGQDGPFVFVVKPDRTVENRPVVLGARVDQQLVIEKGLEAGETVVTEGQLRLAPGSRVQIREGAGRPAQRKPPA